MANSQNASLAVASSFATLPAMDLMEGPLRAPNDAGPAPSSPFEPPKPEDEKETEENAAEKETNQEKEKEKEGEEMSRVVVSPAQLRAFAASVQREAAATRGLRAAVDDLARCRAQRYAEMMRALRRRTAGAGAGEGEGEGEGGEGASLCLAGLRLRLQEAEERGARWLHENIVLTAQQAELQEQLAAVVELARVRGQRLRSKGGPFGGGESKGKVGREREGLRLETGAAAGRNTFSLRAVAARGGAVAHADAMPRVAGVDDADDEKSGLSSIAIGEERKGGPVTEDVELMAALHSSKEHSATQIVALTEEVHTLRQLLDEQRALYERERDTYLQEGRERDRANIEETQNYLTTINHLEELHECCLRDLTGYRHHAETQLRDLKVQINWLRRSMHEALLVAEKSKQKEKNELLKEIKRVEKRYEPTMRVLNSDLEVHRRNALAERRAHEEALREKDECIERLKAALQREKVLLSRTEEHHRLEMEGVRSELDLMRQSLRQMEKKVFFRRALEEAAAPMEDQNIADYYFRYQ